jgi:hypothetical protein
MASAHRTLSKALIATQGYHHDESYYNHAMEAVRIARLKLPENHPLMHPYLTNFGKAVQNMKKRTHPSHDYYDDDKDNVLMTKLLYMVTKDDNDDEERTMDQRNDDDDNEDYDNDNDDDENNKDNDSYMYLDYDESDDRDMCCVFTFCFTIGFPSNGSTVEVSAVSKGSSGHNATLG